MNETARAQLEQLASATGPIQLQQVVEKDGLTLFKVSLDTRGIEHQPGGIKVRAREVFWFVVSADFPFEHPSILADHRRWAGTPHVQWSRSICIYAAPSVEWNPADGMRGLIDRLVLWLERAALGTLDPEGQPLHPPVAYSSASAGHLVVRADLGDRVPWGPSSTDPTNVLFAWCAAEGDRTDVIEWATLQQVLDRVTAEGFSPTDDHGRPLFIAVSAFISDQIAFEYPRKAQALLNALASSGLSTDRLLVELSRARFINSILERDLVEGTTLPNIVILGTPSRRIDTEQLAHLSAWQLEGTNNTLAKVVSEATWGVLKDDKAKIYTLAKNWLKHADIAWMRVWEDRAEVTRPRDGGTTAFNLRNRKVLLLGCGALGGPIGEHCVRAGVSKLTVVDEGRVNPGVLSRQPYADADISKPKATVLATRLSSIRRDLDVHDVVGDAKDIINTAPAPQDFDLVIDATADIGVRSAIESRRSADRPNWPDLVSVMIGHDATAGIVTISAAGASGGPVDVLRRFSLSCLASPALTDIADDFFPAESRGDLFFPEPGCSSPTFIGSHADVTALAGMLLNEGLRLLADADASPMGAAAVRRDSRELPAVDPRGWTDDVIVADSNGGYEVRIAQAALDEMRAEARRGRRIRGPRVETGGMLLGAIDDATQTINVDRVVGPPPDSFLSDIYFRHGTVGTQNIVDERRKLTRERQNFIGLWHTHPWSRAAPSGTDDEGMWEVVNLHGIGRRALMIILGGDTWQQWLRTGTDPAIYARVSTLERIAPAPSAIASVVIPDGTAFRGGFAYPADFHANPGAHAS